MCRRKTAQCDAWLTAFFKEETMANTTNIPERLAAIRAVSPAQLREQYRELFGEESRSGNRQWLLRRCAWRLQALAEGDLLCSLLSPSAESVQG